MTGRRSLVERKAALPGCVSTSGASAARVLPVLSWIVALAGLVGLLALAPAAAADASAVALNEVNCTGTDWVEVVNRSNADVSLAGWLLTDDALDRVPQRDSHRWRFGDQAVLAPGARLVVTQGEGGFPFGLSCGDDTLRLADAADALVDSFTLPVLSTGGRTLGRIPDGTGDWTVTLPTPGEVNVVAADGPKEDPAWLYDPLRVTEIELEASQAALAQLDAEPGEYVQARITMRSGGTSYGPYLVGLKLKGHAAFRPLEGKAAFKVKFGFAVSGQTFYGLKGLTLNNMVQDPSMLAEATTSLLLAAAGAPASRVGFAYVRLNGAEYGLYANVENIDAVMAKRWSSGTRHIYEANLGGEDAIPGGAGDFEVDEGSSTDRSDLEALSAANAGGAAGWWERMQPVADLAEMTRVWAAEHYAGHWDGYSVAGGDVHPSNYYLHSDPAGRFSLITSGTDQTWQERSLFGVYGSGVLMRGCVADATCRQLYIDALRELAASPQIAALPEQVRAIRDVIAPWRARDPRSERTAELGEVNASVKIALMERRATDLAGWLASPFFVDDTQSPATGGGDEGTSGEESGTGTVEGSAGGGPLLTGAQPPSTPAPATPAPLVRPVLGKAVAVPGKPIAGRPFTLSLAVTRSDSGRALLTGRMTCAPTIAGKLVKHTDSFKAGKVKLSLVVPKTAKGKLLKIKLAVTASGRTASRTYSYAVR